MRHYLLIACVLLAGAAVLKNYPWLSRYSAIFEYDFDGRKQLANILCVCVILLLLAVFARTLFGRGRIRALPGVLWNADAGMHFTGVEPYSFEAAASDIAGCLILGEARGVYSIDVISPLFRHKRVRAHVESLVLAEFKKTPLATHMTLKVLESGTVWRPVIPILGLMHFISYNKWRLAMGQWGYMLFQIQAKQLID